MEKDSAKLDKTFVIC